MQIHNRDQSREGQLSWRIKRFIWGNGRMSNGLDEGNNYGRMGRIMRGNGGIIV